MCEYKLSLKWFLSIVSIIMFNKILFFITVSFILIGKGFCISLSRLDNIQHAIGIVKRDQKPIDVKDIQYSVDQLTNLGQDKWVGFLFRASPVHFYDVVEHVKEIISVDCDEDEDDGEERCDETDDNDNSNCSDDGSWNNEDRGNKKHETTIIVNSTMPLKRLIIGLEGYANATDPKSILEKVGKFNYSDFTEGVENTQTTNNTFERIDAKDVKNNDMKTWLTQTAVRRARILKGAINRQSFNESSAFKSEEFHYREGNIYLDDDDDDFSGEGSKTSFSVIAAILQLAFIITLTF